MSWFSDVTNAVNNAVDAVQDVVDTVADTVQGAANTALDAAQTAASAGVDRVQDGVGDIAATYDAIFGTSIFAQAAADLNGQVDTMQDVTNGIVDLQQDLANRGFDAAQFLGRDFVDTHQYAHTIVPKMLDDAFGDGSVNMPPVPVMAQMLANQFA